MEDYYKILGVKTEAGVNEIKRAFREKAKKLHPDTSGSTDTLAMRRLLTAYKILSDYEQRFAYDKQFHTKKSEWTYQTYLKERPYDMFCQAKLIFLNLLNFEESAAVEVWARCGGSNFELKKYMDREDWMDCAFLLAEELKKENFTHEAFLILIELIKEEREKPYFKHFTIDVELLLKELVRLKLRRAVDDKLWIECMSSLVDLGFPPREEARYLKSMADTLYKTGDKAAAFQTYQKAHEKDKTIKIPRIREMRDKR